MDTYGLCMSITDQDLAIEAAEAGAAVVRSHYGSSLTRFQKSGGDFATTADVEAEKAIIDVLRAARPQDLVLGEESGHTGTSGNDRIWLVDPLCGTSNYAVRTMLASVNVALRANRRATVAASADPFTNEVFWTDGTAAYVRHGGADERLTSSAESRLVDINLDPPFPNHGVFSAARMLADEGFIEQFRPRVVSTTLAVACVAAGRLRHRWPPPRQRSLRRRNRPLPSSRLCRHRDRRPADPYRSRRSRRGRRPADPHRSADPDREPTPTKGLIRYPVLGICGSRSLP